MTTIYIIALVWVALNAAFVARLLWVDWIRRTK